MKLISIVKERLDGEKRVILTPKEVAYLVESGLTVHVESGSGLGCHFSDEMYNKSGAKIVNQKEAWTSGGIVLKYKAPIADEYPFFYDGLILCALFHAEGNYGLLKRMIEHRVSAYSFEFFMTEDHYFPLAYPGGEIAGKCGFLYAMYHIQSQLGGKGILLCETVGVKKPRIGVIGYGSVGSSVIKMALDLGCEVVVFGNNIPKMRKQQVLMNNNVELCNSTPEEYLRILPTLDALFGAILISTYNTEAVVTEAIIKVMSPGTVIVDITCGYGDGYLPFIKGYTSLSEPVIKKYGLIFIKIDNLPSAYHLTTTVAYAKNLLPYIIHMASDCFDGIPDAISRSGKILSQGEIVHNVIREHIEYYENHRI